MKALEDPQALQIRIIWGHGTRAYKTKNIQTIHNQSLKEIEYLRSNKGNRIAEANPEVSEYKVGCIVNLVVLLWHFN